MKKKILIYLFINKNLKKKDKAKVSFILNHNFNRLNIEKKNSIFLPYLNPQ